MQEGIFKNNIPSIWNELKLLTFKVIFQGQNTPFSSRSEKKPFLNST